MTGAGHRRARRLQRRRRDRHRHSWSTDSEGNRLLASLHERRRRRPRSIDLTPGSRRSGALYDGMTADGSKVFFTTADQLGQRHGHQRRHLSRRRHRKPAATLTRVSTGIEGTGNTDVCEPSANTVHDTLEHDGLRRKLRRPGDRRRRRAWPPATARSTSSRRSRWTAPLERRSERPQPLRRPTGLGTPLRPQRWSRTRTRRYRPPRIRSCARSGPSKPPRAWRSITRAATSTSSTSVRTSAPEPSFKFDSSGHPVLNFGNNGKLAVAGVIGAFNFPPQIAVDNDPSQLPTTGISTLPDFLEESSRGSTPRVPTSRTSARGSPVGVAVNPANGNVYIANGFFGSGVSIYSADGAPITSFRRSLDSPDRHRRRLERQRLRRQRRRLLQCQRNHRGLRLLGHRPRTAHRRTRPVRWRSIPRTITSTSTRRTGIEFDAAGQPGRRSDRLGDPLGIDRLRRGLGQRRCDQPRANSVESFGPAVIPLDPDTDNPVVVDSRSPRREPATPATSRSVPLGRPRRLHLDPAADRLRQRRPPRGLPLRRQASAPRLRVLQPDREEADRRGDASLERPRSHRRRPGLLQLDRRPGRSRSEQQSDAYEWEPQGSGDCQEEADASS